jgi:hypothetical protein
LVFAVQEEDWLHDLCQVKALLLKGVLFQLVRACMLRKEELFAGKYRHDFCHWPNSKAVDEDLGDEMGIGGDKALKNKTMQGIQHVTRHLDPISLILMMEFEGALGGPT